MPNPITVSQFTHNFFRKLDNSNAQPWDLGLMVDYILWRLLAACRLSQCTDILTWQENGLLTRIGHKVPSFLKFFSAGLTKIRDRDYPAGSCKD